MNESGRALEFGLTYHVEGPLERPSAEIYGEIAGQVRLADRLGFSYAWFSEHHGHAHYGHMPAPLLFALHLACQTEHIRLGTAIICLNLHDPIDVAEQVAVADTLADGRMSVGFGSGSTPDEFALFGRRVTEPDERHELFEESLFLGGQWAKKRCRGLHNVDCGKLELLVVGRILVETFNLPPEDPGRKRFPLPDSLAPRAGERLQMLVERRRKGER